MYFASAEPTKQEGNFLWWCAEVYLWREREGWDAGNCKSAETSFPG